MKKVIIDTGPLLAFAKAGRVNTLKDLFKQLIMTKEVYIEVFSKKSPENDSIKEHIGRFIKVRELNRIDDKKINEAVQILDDGEKSSILLCHDLIEEWMRGIGLLGLIPFTTRLRANAMAFIKFDFPDALAPYITPALRTLISLRLLPLSRW